MRIATMAAIWASIATAAAGAAAPTFDCVKAAHEIELLICADQELAKLDHEMARTYAAAIAALAATADRPTATRELRAVQRGWIKGRNDCWKAADQRQCALDSYATRIAELEARYMLLPGGKPVFYECNGNPADEIAATFYQGNLPAVRLERGDSLAIGVLSPSASGAKYVAAHGITFWSKGDEVLVEWPEGNRFNCAVRK